MISIADVNALSLHPSLQTPKAVREGIPFPGHSPEHNIGGVSDTAGHKDLFCKELWLRPITRRNKKLRRTREVVFLPATLIFFHPLLLEYRI